jgi:hypothetical protein
MESQQKKAREPISDDIKRNLLIHTVITFVLFIAPMFISYLWWPITSPLVAGLWFFILLEISGRQGHWSRFLKPASLIIIALSLLNGILLALDLSIEVLERFRSYFTLFGTLVPILMFFSLFFLFFFYRKRI